VAVSGLGGDELFGGYPSFLDIPRWVKYLSIGRHASVGRLLRQTATALGLQRLGLNPKALALLEFGGDFAGAYLVRRGLYMPWELKNILDHATISEGLRRLEPIETVKAQMVPASNAAFAKVASLESSIYMRNQLLRDTDWASMAHSLEVRTPLVDATLLEKLANICGTDGRSKHWLAAAPLKPLPASVVRRKKTGFRVPTTDWIKDEISRSVPSEFSESRNWALYVNKRPELIGNEI
jgi:asparagine synthase (glutamine-hydrolysing)